MITQQSNPPKAGELSDEQIASIRFNGSPPFFFSGHGFGIPEEYFVATKDEIHRFARAAIAAHEAQRVKAEPVVQVGEAPYHFYRYVNGQERAENVLVEKATTLQQAMKIAASICPARPMTVLVHVPNITPQPDPVATSEAVQPLTYRQIADATTAFADVRSDKTIGIARAIEAAHGIGKETP